MLIKDASRRPRATDLLSDPYFAAEGARLAPVRINHMMRRAMIYTEKATAFDKALLLVIARHSKLEELTAFRAAFKKFDATGTGQLRQEDIAAAFSSQGFTLSSEELNRIFNAVDVNQLGKIEYTEW